MQRLTSALLPAVLLLVLCSCSYEPIKTSRAVDKREIIGNYTYAKNGGGEVRLKLKADGSFKQTVQFEEDGQSVEVSGTWRVDGAYLILDGLWISDPRDPARQKTKDGEPLGTTWWIVDAPRVSCRLYGGDHTEPSHFEYISKVEE